jgi:hypothetical protein
METIPNQKGWLTDYQQTGWLTDYQQKQYLF